MVPPDEYSRIALAETAAALGSTLAGAGLAAALARFALRPGHESDPDGTARVVSTVAQLASVAAVAMAGILILAGPPLVRLLLPHFEVPLWPHLAVALFAAFVSQWLQIPLTVYRVERNSFGFVAVTLGQQLLAVVLVGAALFFASSSLSVLLARALAAAVVLAALLPSFGARMRLPFDRGHAHDALRFGIPLVPHTIIAFALAAGDRFILERYRPLSEVGLYSLAYSFGMVLTTLTSAMMLAWGPEFHRLAGRGVNGERAIATTTEELSLLLAFVTSVTSILLPALLPVLLPESYHSVGGLTPPILAGYFFHALFSLFHLGLLQARRTEILALLTFGAAAMNIALNFALVPEYGAMGAAWATLLAYAAEAAVVMVFVRRVYPLPTSTRRIAPGALAVVACATVSVVPAAWMWVAYPLAMALALGLILLALGRVGIQRLQQRLRSWMPTVTSV